MQKIKDGSSVKDSLGSFGFAVNEIPWPSEETQEPNVRTWPGEHGEDAYIPPTGLKLKAYDLEVEFLCKSGAEAPAQGQINGSAYEAYKALRNYLTGIDGTGGELKIYDPYWGKGRTKVYLKKISDLEPFRTNVDEGVSVKATFRVTDPMTEIVIGKDANGNIISLGAEAPGQ